MERVEQWKFRPRSMAERTNLWRITSHAYEPLWRRFSTKILTRGAWTLEQECKMVCEMLLESRDLSAEKVFLYPSDKKSPTRKLDDDDETPGKVLPEDSVYLDLGSSTGVYARAVLAAAPEAKVILVDYSRQMLRKAEKTMKQNYRAVFYQCDAAFMPFQDESIDGVVMGGTLNELTEPELVLRQVSRVMQGGAHAVIMHLVRLQKKIAPLQKIARCGGVWLPLAEEADRLFEEAGLEPIHTLSAGVMRISALRKQ